jgi:hypothetical protein
MMVIRMLLSVLTLLFGIGILLSALEWTAMDPAPAGSADGSRPVQLRPCPETCLVP